MTNKSNLAVGLFIDGGKKPFNKRLDVLVIADKEYLFTNITVTINYNAAYMQYDVVIMWEEDSSKPDYRTLELHGQYNTNFQIIEHKNCNLSFIDGNNRITIFGSRSHTQ